MVTHSYFHNCACNLNTYLAVYGYVQTQLTTSGHISRNETWKARSAYVAASSVVTFCIHTEISAQLAFIDIWKDGIHQQFSINACKEYINTTLYASHNRNKCITCAVESISLIARVAAAVVTSNGINAVSISITFIETIRLTFINI